MQENLNENSKRNHNAFPRTPDPQPKTKIAR